MNTGVKGILGSRGGYQQPNQVKFKAGRSRSRGYSSERKFNPERFERY